MTPLIKVCFVTPYAYSLFNEDTSWVFGGSEVRAKMFGAELTKKSDLEISFVVFDYGQDQFESSDGIRVYPDAYFGKRRRSTATEEDRSIRRVAAGLAKILQEARNLLRVWQWSPNVDERFNTYREINPDFLCTFGVSDFSADLIRFAKKLNKKSVLFLGSGGDLDPRYLSHPKSRNDYGSLNHHCAYALKNAGIIICQTEDQKKVLRKTFNRESWVIKNPISIGDIDIHAQDEVPQRVLWVGKSDRVKQPDILLELAVAHPEVPFTMIMNRSDSRIHEHILSRAPSNVKIIEKVKFSQIESHFAKACLLVNTSKFEGFPNTFLQAGKYGVPILSLGVDPDGFLSSSECGFCAQGDLDLLTMRLGEIIEDSDKFRTWSKNIRRYVSENHDLKIKAEELAAVLREQCALFFEGRQNSVASEA